MTAPMPKYCTCPSPDLHLRGKINTSFMELILWMFKWCIQGYFHNTRGRSHFQKRAAVGIFARGGVQHQFWALQSPLESFCGLLPPCKMSWLGVKFQYTFFWQVVCVADGEGSSYVACRPTEPVQTVTSASEQPMTWELATAGWSRMCVTFTARKYWANKVWSWWLACRANGDCKSKCRLLFQENMTAWADCFACLLTIELSESHSSSILGIHRSIKIACELYGHLVW